MPGCSFVDFYEEFFLIERSSMAELVYKGCISEWFEGFDENNLYIMDDGSCWIQDDFNYSPDYEYRPDVIILEIEDRYVMFVGDESAEVIPANIVTISEIDGEFNGWEEGVIYRLCNGEIWRQIGFEYEFDYAFEPLAVVCEVDGDYIMYVEGKKAVVERLN